MPASSGNGVGYGARRSRCRPLTARRGYGSARSMKNRLLPLVALVLSGCYTTKVYTPAAAQGPELHDRQWFTIGGLVPLSEPTGQECPGGLSRAESKLGAVDVLINIGLAVAGGVAGGVMCRNESAADRSTCTSVGAGLVPFFIAARTVEYTCAGRGAAADAPVRARAAQSAPELGQGGDEVPQVGLGDAELRSTQVH